MLLSLENRLKCARREKKIKTDQTTVCWKNKLFCISFQVGLGKYVRQKNKYEGIQRKRKELDDEGEVGALEE